MSLAKDVAFPEDADVLLRYGVLRQQAEVHQRIFREAHGMPYTVLPGVCKPGVLMPVRDAVPALSMQSLRSAQRSSPWLNQLIWEMTSGTFIRGLEANTGLQHILADPGFDQGGWLHRDSAGDLSTWHSRWQLPAVLVLDLLMACNAQHACVVMPDATRVNMAEEDALVWQLKERGDGPQWPAGAQVLRCVYYQGAADQ
jgi:hypothetical protein